MLFCSLAGLILGFILSFFGAVEWFRDILCPDFLEAYLHIIYYGFFLAVGAVIGYFGSK